MKEIEKRLGLNQSDSNLLKEKLNNRFEPIDSTGRTVLVKVEGEGFQPDPNVLVDLKVKLIGPDSILSIKHGSWHGDVQRDEYDIHFNRNDLAQVIGGLSVFGYDKFVMFSTLRTTWRDEELMYTLDEYRNIGQSLFEVEAEGNAKETQVNDAFANLGIEPMGSDDTIAFISGLNQHRSAQVDLSNMTPFMVANQMIEAHPYDS